MKKHKLETETNEQPLNKVGRIHKFHDFVLANDLGLDSIPWTNFGNTFELTKIPLASYGGYGSNTRTNNKIVVRRIEFRIVIYPGLLGLVVSPLDHLRTIIVWDRAPKQIGEGAKTITPPELLKNFALSQGNTTTDSYSYFNVENADRFKILYDDHRELLIPKNTGEIFSWMLDYIVDRRKVACSIVGELKDLNLLTEYDNDEPEGLNTKTGAIYIFTMGKFAATQYKGYCWIRTHFDDELVDKSEKHF